MLFLSLTLTPFACEIWIDLTIISNYFRSETLMNLTWVEPLASSSYDATKGPLVDFCMRRLRNTKKAQNSEHVYVAVFHWQLDKSQSTNETLSP